MTGDSCLPDLRGYASERARRPAIALLVLACAPGAWASYGQMRLEGVAFALVITALGFWGVLLAVALAAGLGKHKVFTILATGVTGALVIALVASLGDGSAAMRQRPLGGWAVFALLMMAATPVMLGAPLLQLAWHAYGRASRVPAFILAATLAFVTVGSLLFVALREGLERRAFAQARSASQGQIMQHVVAARHTPAVAWLSPFVWTEGDEVKWVIIGVSNLPFIDSAAPLSDEDTRAVALLVTSSAATPNAVYTGRLEGKLVWDRLVRAVANDRAAVVAGLTRREAQRFTEYIVVPHADWLCAPLAGPETRNAIERLWTLLPEHDQRQFSARIREKCAVAVGTPPS